MISCNIVGLEKSKSHMKIPVEIIMDEKIMLYSLNLRKNTLSIIERPMQWSIPNIIGRSLMNLRVITVSSKPSNNIFVPRFMKYLCIS